MANCSAGQIKFYRKNHIDLDRPNPVLTVTDSVAANTGENSLKFLRNRSNNSGWNTTLSDDSANTEILIDLKDYQNIDTIMLIKHNFKSFLIEYYNVSSGLFEEYAAVTDNELTTSILEKSVNSNSIKITIYGTVIPDSDKGMRQLIITEKFGVGEFVGFPQIKKPVSSLNKKVNTLLSGRANIVETRGSFSVDLTVKFLTIDSDLAMIEDIYFNREGVLIQLSGGDEDQFRTKRVGYRNEDIVLVRPVNELELPYEKGVYSNGIKINMKLQEAVF